MPLRNWSNNITYSTDVLHRPANVEELQKLIADADGIHALGTGHTFNTISDTDGALVSVAGLRPAIDIDSAARTVRAAAGLRFAEIAAALQDAGWALPNLGSLPHISLAGACATGTHGSGNQNQCLAAGVVAAELVSADGSILRFDEDDAAFHGAVLALGALGIVTSLTMRIEPTYEIRQDVWLDAPFDAVLQDLEDIMAAGYSVSVFTDFHRPAVVDKIWIKSRVPGPIADGTTWGARPATTPQHPITGEDTASATEQFGSPGPWFARLPHFRPDFRPSSGVEQQSEWLLPREHGAAALAAVREVDLGAAVQVCELRTVAADELWLSPCHGRDTIAVHFTWVDDNALVDAAVRGVEAALAAYDPRPHWGKVFRADPRGHYPRLTEFRTLLQRYDPDRKLGNDFLRRYVY